MILASGVIFLGAAFLVYDDSLLFSHRISSDSLIEVGEITSVENDVRGKVRENFAWLPIRQKMRVFNGDSIFTGPSSNVNLKLNSGTEMSIEENSLVVIKTDSNDLNLQLKYGEVAKIAKQSGSVYLDQNGNRSVLQAKGATIKIQAKLGKPVQIKVLSGNVDLHASGKPLVKLSSNDAVQISDNGIEQKKSLDVELLKPKKGDTLWVNEKIKTKFTWDTGGEVRYFQLEVSKSKSFSRPLVKR